MDFEKIKQIMPRKGERYIIIENGKPEIVLLTFDDYKEITQNNPLPSADLIKQPLIESIEPVKPEQVGAPSSAQESADELEKEVEQMTQPIVSLEEQIPDVDAKKQELPEASGDEASELTIDDLPF